MKTTTTRGGKPSPALVADDLDTLLSKTFADFNDPLALHAACCHLGEALCADPLLFAEFKHLFSCLQFCQFETNRQTAVTTLSVNVLAEIFHIIHSDRANRIKAANPDLTSERGGSKGSWTKRLSGANHEYQKDFDRGFAVLLALAASYDDREAFGALDMVSVLPRMVLMLADGHAVFDRKDACLTDLVEVVETIAAADTPAPNHAAVSADAVLRNDEAAIATLWKDIFPLKSGQSRSDSDPSISRYYVCYRITSVAPDPKLVKSFMVFQSPGLLPDGKTLRQAFVSKTFTRPVNSERTRVSTGFVSQFGNHIASFGHRRWYDEITADSPQTITSTGTKGLVVHRKAFEFGGEVLAGQLLMTNSFDEIVGVPFIAIETKQTHSSDVTIDTIPAADLISDVLTNTRYQRPVDPEPAVKELRAQDTLMDVLTGRRTAQVRASVVPDPADFDLFNAARGTVERDVSEIATALRSVAVLT